MLPVVWSDEADADLDRITAYIGQFDVHAAVRLWGLVLSSVERLSEYPYLYRKSERTPGCREIVVHPNYIVVYRVGLSCIEVLRVVHARREYP